MADRIPPSVVSRLCLCVRLGLQAVVGMAIGIVIIAAALAAVIIGVAALI